MIILFPNGGRTGNQLFQLSHAMSARRKGEWLVTLQYGKTRSLLSSSCKNRWLNVELPFFRLTAELVLYTVIFQVFIRTGLLSYLHDHYSRYTLHRGKIRSLTIMKGFFESSRQLSENLLSFFRLNGSLRSRARSLLSAQLGGRTPVFIHIRRTDLKTLAASPQEVKRMLPDQYYREAVRILQERSRSVFFVVVGDDPDHAEALFKDLEPKFVSRLSVAEDLSLMSLCDGGVLSNSTFAWWGAFFGGGSLGYVVPKYWSGFEQKFWHPPGIRARFMTDFVEIS